MNIRLLLLFKMNLFVLLILIIQTVFSILSIPLSKCMCDATIWTILSNHHLSALTSCWGCQQPDWSSASSSIHLPISKVHLNRWYRPFVRIISLRNLLYSSIIGLNVYICLFNLFSLISFVLIKILILLVFIYLLCVIINHKVWILGYVFWKNILRIFIL